MRKLDPYLFGFCIPLLLLVATDANAATDSDRDPLLSAFQQPPDEARPRVWWHWMNGNVTEDGIAKDLAWMKRIGIAGAQTFDANIRTPQIVDHRLVYMTPEWKKAFRFAASEADRLGLELAIASSPGWSETGGSWVQPADALKKLVWSETRIDGGKPFTGRLPQPPSVTGPFQWLASKEEVPNSSASSKTGYYTDVAVLAFPVEEPIATSAVTRDFKGELIDARALTDGDISTEIRVPVASAAGAERWITFEYETPQTFRSARLFAPKATNKLLGSLFTPRLEASEDGKAWRAIAEVPIASVPTTAGFAPVTARHFRLVLKPRIEALGNLMQFGSAFKNMMGPAGIQSFFGQPTPIAEFSLSAENRIDRAEAKAAYSLEPDYQALSRDVPDTAGIDPSRVVDLTARLRPDGTLEWIPPAGRWSVLRLGSSLTGATNHPASPEATGLEVDKFDGDAVRRYLDHYFGMYRDASGGLIGKRGVRAIVTDSSEFGTANWTPKMVAQFQHLRGYDPTAWLPALTGIIIGSRLQSDRFLADFRRTLADLHATEHYGTIAKVAHENGLKVYGEALEDKRPVIGDDLDLRRFADIPMAAMWTYEREAGPRLTLVADIKGAASVAHVYGQNVVAAESLTAAGPTWGWSPAELKRIIDLEFALGINRPVIHTSVHSPVDDKVPGLSLGGIGQYFNRHESWAEMAKPWIDYMARNSLLLQQGRNFADVAYFYGEEAPITGLWGERPISDAPRSNAYDFVNAAVLADAMKNDGTELVTPGGARYRALYLGGQSDQISLPTLRAIARLVRGGGTVIGSRPTGNPSLAGDAAEWTTLVDQLWSGQEQTLFGKGRVIAAKDVESGLKASGVAADFRYSSDKPDSEILFNHRRLTDGDSYFLTNRKDRSEAIEARFRVTGKAPELWHAESGETQPISYRIEGGETVVTLTLRADEAVHVVFRKAATAKAMNVLPPRISSAERMDGPWTVRFQQDRGAPSSITMSTLAPLNQSSDPGVRYFSGTASYQRTFRPPSGWKPGKVLKIDLGTARDVAEVWINGKLAGSAWHAPYQVDVSRLVRRGENRLEIRVANLWVNRLIGDAQPGAKPITWTGLQPYGPNAPLRDAGLIGPIALIQVSKD